MTTRSAFKTREPVEAVEAFFGTGVPQDAEFEVHGSEIHVVQDGRTVAIIWLLGVPDGYVVESYDACAGVIQSSPRIRRDA